MNQVLECLKTRRSIRKYQNKPVEEALLDAILEAGTYAPSGHGKQAPIIIAVKDEKTKATLTKMNAQVMGVSSDPYYNPPIILLVLADPKVNTYVYDGSCVLENMMIAAHALGLGTCWINREKEMFDSAEGKALLKEWGIDESYVGIGALSLGYIDGDAPQPKPRKADYITKI